MHIAQKIAMLEDDGWVSWVLMTDGPQAYRFTASDQYTSIVGKGETPDEAVSEVWRRAITDDEQAAVDQAYVDLSDD